MKRYRQFRGLILTLTTSLEVALALAGAFLIRFEFTIPGNEFDSLRSALWIAIVTKLVMFRLTGCHRLGWRYIGIFDLTRALWGNLAASAAFSVTTYWTIGSSFPRSVYVVDFLLCFLITGGSRALVRLYYEGLLQEVARSSHKRVLIYGAGAAGRALAREFYSNPGLNYRAVGFIDDDFHKRHTSVACVPVLGNGREIPMLVERSRKKQVPIEEVIVSMPSASGRQIQEALANCRAAAVACKTMPSVGELLDDRVLASQIRSITVEDLLGREPVRLEEGLIRSSIASKVVMVTGGGGSIGSELCRQVASLQPCKVVIFERAESDLFRIQMELADRFPSVPVVPAIGDVREYASVDNIIRRHKVQSVFHAAAYKHVPMMEDHLVEAVRNNITGTWNVARACQRNGVSTCLLISSDKAVNPTNIMGLTKRVSELIVSGMPTASEGGVTKWVAVRFGNVLNSNGSVVPIFHKQIAAGGPVTVTHPEVRRYFMTIPEAVQLILQASAMAKGSEVFVLDMGEPVLIADLARNMIRLSGREPDTEVEIQFVGLRPGEKLCEEVITEGENILPTHHEKIRIFSGPRLTPEKMTNWLLKLDDFLKHGDEREILKHMKILVPEYKASDQWRTPRGKEAVANGAGRR